MSSDNYVTKVEFDVSSFCRCCLSTNKNNYCDLNNTQFEELTGISLTQYPDFPKWICAVCNRLFDKAVSFKTKALKTQNLLCQYAEKTEPFEVNNGYTDNQEALQLTFSPVLCFDTLGRAKNGYHEVLEHKTQPQKTELITFDVDFDDIKMEMDFEDYDDNIPLGEYKLNIERLPDEEMEVKTEKKKKKKDKKRKRDSPEPEPEVEPPAVSLRRHIEIDPTKIRIIDLDPVEQVKQRKEESEGYKWLPYKCELCYKGFNFQDKLDNHMKKHSPSRGKFKCTLCHMHLPTPHSYGVHMLIHTRRYECLKCGRRMTDRASIVEHYRSTHEGIVRHFTCHVCGKVSSNNKTHRGHMRNHHGGDRPKCDQCGKSFVNKDSLSEHLLIHQGVKNHKCDECGKTFRTKTHLKYHLLKHTDVKEFYCVECDTRFKSAHNLRQHLQKSLKHKDVNSFKHACPDCSKRFETQSRMESHLATVHLGARPHSCDVCGTGLASRSSLAKHIRTHTQPPPRRTHVCHTCGRGFTGASTLANHARTHTGERPFQCARCGRGFAQRAAMLTHVKLVHLKVKRGAKVKPEILEPEKSQLKYQTDEQTHDQHRLANALEFRPDEGFTY